MLNSFIIKQIIFYTNTLKDLYTDLYNESLRDHAQLIKSEYKTCTQLLNLVKNSNFNLKQLNSKQLNSLYYIINEWALLQNTTNYTVNELQQLQTLSNNIKTLL